MIDYTFSRVSTLIRENFLLSTFDAVVTETPAARATSRRVGRGEKVGVCRPPESLDRRSGGARASSDRDICSKFFETRSPEPSAHEERLSNRDASKMRSCILFPPQALPGPMPAPP